MELLVWIVIVIAYILIQALSKKRQAPPPPPTDLGPLPGPPGLPAYRTRKITPESGPEAGAVKAEEHRPGSEPGPKPRPEPEPRPGREPSPEPESISVFEERRGVAAYRIRGRRRRHRVLGASRGQLRRAIVLREVLGPPRGLE